MGDRDRAIAQINLSSEPQQPICFNTTDLKELIGKSAQNNPYNRHRLHLHNLPQIQNKAANILNRANISGTIRFVKTVLQESSSSFKSH